MNFKKFNLLLLSLILIMSISSTVFAKTTIRYSHPASSDICISVEEAWGRVFKGIVEAETNGEIEVKIFSSAQLGDQRQSTEGVQMRTIEMAAISDSVLTLFYPKAAIMTLPYAFEDPDDVVKFWETDFAKEWAENCKKETGIKILSMVTFGFRNFTNNVRPIKTPEDMKGLSIRVQQSPIFIEIIKALGAIPTPMSVNELYSALQTGLLDGQENPFSTIMLYSLHEVQKYLTNMGYIAGIEPIIINAKFYDSLSGEYKEIINKAAHRADQAFFGSSHVNNYGKGLTVLAEHMDIYTPTVEEREKFKEAIQPAALKIIEEQVGKEYLNEYLEVLKNL